LEKVKSIDKKILIGILLAVGFLIIWLVTLPQSVKEISSTLTNEPSVNTQTDDIDMYNRAIIMDNSLYCNKIIDTKLKTECKINIRRYVEEDTTIETPANTPEDIDSYNRAIILKDSSYCNNIIDPILRSECLKEMGAI
jgi:hypothetical protein